VTSLDNVGASSRVVLAAETARDLMTPKPLCIPENAPVTDAARLLNRNHFSAVPVVNPAGRPVGVLSRADIVRHVCECFTRARQTPEDEADANLWSLGPLDGLPVPAKKDPTEVRLVMTPIICTVSPETPALRIVEEMLSRQVHRLFVVQGEELIGVITSMDVLRKLRTSEARVEGSVQPASEPQPTGGTVLAEQLGQAHAALLIELRKLREAARAGSRTTDDELLSRLKEVRTVVGRHFRLEETNGYLENVRKRQPQSDLEIQKLWTEHREILSSLDALIAEAAGPTAGRERLGQQVRAWIDRLRAHESHENALVQDAFNLEIAAED
jgi:CBS domain-containing protein